MSDIDALEAAARAATPGPWYAYDRGVYIVVAQPATILALCERVRALEAMLFDRKGVQP